MLVTALSLRYIGTKPKEMLARKEAMDIQGGKGGFHITVWSAGGPGEILGVFCDWSLDSNGH